MEYRNNFIYLLQDKSQDKRAGYTLLSVNSRYSDGGKKCNNCKNLSRFYTKKQAKNLTGLVDYGKKGATDLGGNKAVLSLIHI